MGNINTKVNINGIEFKNPVIMASGTFGFGQEYNEIYDVSVLGGISSKGLTINPKEGNDGIRVYETHGGMMNSVGLQNPGVDYFIENELPFLEQFDTKVIVNLAGRTVEEYCEVASKLSHTSVDLLELNISCPNVKEGGIGFGTSPQMAEEVTRAVKKVSKQPLIVKLSPNVTDITEIARAVEYGGADAISLINTLIGMKIDIHKIPTLSF